MKPLNVLEICSGSGVMGAAFKSKNHNVITIDVNPDYHPDIVMDCMLLKKDSIPFVPDVVWFSPPCTTYSIAGIGHHRSKNYETEEVDPISIEAWQSDMMINHVLNVISEWNPKLAFMENPRGGLRKMRFVTSRTGLTRYTITYCQYGDSRMKPTDVWVNDLEVPFKPMCHNGDSCHERAPRHSCTGTQGLKNAYERSKIPQQLCDFIVEYCENKLCKE